MEPVAHDVDGLLEQATALLDGGEFVVLPMGGAYALCADALQDTAAGQLFLALDRPADAGLDVVLAGFDHVHHVAFATPLGKRLTDALWPGPLTLRLRARPFVPDEVTGGSDTVGIRSPREPFTLALARHFGPLAVAELPARDAPAARACAGHAAKLLVDGGPRDGLRNTLVDATGPVAKVLRDGAVGAAEVEAVGR